MWWYMVVNTILMVLNSNVIGIEVDLMTTAEKTSDFNWKIYNPNYDGVSPLVEWEEVTYSIGKDVKRGFQICPPNDSRLPTISQKSQSWLAIPGIDVTNIFRIFIELKFTLRDCADLEKASCRETFSVYYVYGDGLDTFRFDHMLYTKIDTVAAEIRFTPSSSSEMEQNKETVFVSNPLNKKVLNIAVVDEGACMAIISIRVFHKICPAVTSHFAYFNTSLTGQHETSLIPVTGKCVKNSVTSRQQNQPVFHCTSEGIWQVQTGECVCVAGYMPNDEQSECIPCRMNTFKFAKGNTGCETCPHNSHTESIAAKTCTCNSGFFQDHNIGLQNISCDYCATFPSKPEALNISTLSPGDIKILWDKPKLDGSCEVIYYCVVCSTGMNLEDDASCADIKFTPSNCVFGDHEVIVENLLGYVNYNFTIFALNDVAVNQLPQFKEQRFYFQENRKLELKFLLESQVSSNSVHYSTSETLPSPPLNLHVKYATLTNIAVLWNAPAHINGNITFYEINWISSIRFKPDVFRYILLSKDPSFSQWNKLTLKNTSVIITGLYPGSKYNIFVRAINGAGPSNISKVLEAHTSPLEASSKSPVGTDSFFTKYKLYFIAGLVAIVVLLLIVIGSLLVHCQCKKQKRNKSSAYSHTRSNSTEESHQMFSVVREVPDQRTYVDPFSLNTTPLHDFACEITPESVYFDTVIGTGEFGDVYKGQLLTSDGISEVAIKKLKDQCEPEEQVNFLREAYFLHQFHHPNIVSLKAVVTKTRPFVIITELMANGSLLSYLLAKKAELDLQVDLIPAIPVLTLIEMLQGVARGMLYLTSRGYVHRDLAARNVLCDENLTCKVADFGMMREISPEMPVDQTCVKSGKIAIRWTSPEAIAHKTFSEASDVWSFGILCWEALTYGEKPYWNLTNQDVVLALNEGFRLPAPETCPNLLYQLMLNCWLEESSSRLKFSQIVDQLQYFKLHNDELQVLVSPSNTGLSDNEEEEQLFQYGDDCNGRDSLNRHSFLTKTDDSLSCSSTICASDITMCAAPSAFVFNNAKSGFY